MKHTTSDPWTDLDLRRALTVAYKPWDEGGRPLEGRPFGMAVAAVAALMAHGSPELRARVIPAVADPVRRVARYVVAEVAYESAPSAETLAELQAAAAAIAGIPWWTSARQQALTAALSMTAGVGEA